MDVAKDNVDLSLEKPLLNDLSFLIGQVGVVNRNSRFEALREDLVCCRFRKTIKSERKLPLFMLRDRSQELIGQLVRFSLGPCKNTITGRGGSASRAML